MNKDNKEYNTVDINRYGVFSPAGSVKLTDPEIEFIDSRYNSLFCIPDGGCIKVTRQDGSSEIFVCKYIDDYHTMVGGHVYHICQFAEFMERCGCRYEPVHPDGRPSVTLTAFEKDVKFHNKAYSRFLLCARERFVEKIINILNKLGVSGEDIANGLCQDDVIYFEITGQTPDLVMNLTEAIGCRGYADTAWDEYWFVAAENGAPFDGYKAEWTDGSPCLHENGVPGCWDAFVKITGPDGDEFFTGAGAVSDETLAYYKAIVDGHQ